MNERISLLQAELAAELVQIAQVYTTLAELIDRPDLEHRELVIGYHLNVLYGLFKHAFVRIAQTFEGINRASPQWHANLLRAMTLNVRDIRGAVI